MSQSIDYQLLIQDAMRGLIQKVLTKVAKTGLPGAHHFYITFDTLHPDVEMADWLSDRFPEEMTIVIENWFSNLEVTHDGFSITLNFDNSPQPLYIPYEALLGFSDPSTDFGISFNHVKRDDDDLDISDEITHFPGAATLDEEAPMHHVSDEEADANIKRDAEIVSLDQFRKS